MKKPNVVKRFNQDGGEIIRLKVPKKLENSQVVKALRKQSKKIKRGKANG